MTTTVLLETMAGKGSEVGGRFEELRAIIDRVELTEHIGVCLDTCHIWDAGYDIAGDLDGVLSEFDRVIGLERLHAVHLNNSLNPCGSHKDRHAKLLDGCIPPEALVRVTRHPALAELPFILETPNDDAGYVLDESEGAKKLDPTRQYWKQEVPLVLRNGGCRNRYGSYKQRSTAYKQHFRRYFILLYGCP